MFDPLKPVPRFILAPVFVAGAVCFALWAVPELKAVHAKLDQSRADTRDAISVAWSWKRLEQAREGQLTDLRTQAAKSIQAATTRSQASQKASFAAGVMAGRVIERKSHASTSANGPAVPSDTGGVFIDFRALWSDDGTDGQGGKDMPSGSASSPP